MTKPVPAHGTEARYQGSITRPPCRCPKCITGWTQAGQKRLLARLQGRPATIPAESVTRYIALLHAADMTTGQIAAASGVNASTVRDHARAAFPTIRRTTAEKILAVRPRCQVNLGHVPALASTRRCRALYAAGHAPATIAAAHPNLQIRTVEYVVQGARRLVSVANHSAIAEAYQKLAATPGASHRVRERAAAEGWAGPDFWDDEDFDNPDFTPALSDDLNVLKLGSHRRHEIQHLASFNVPEHEIADRLGMARAYVHDLIRDMGKAA
ncbi:hypothetical protein ABT154_21590 [Streptomyces sp. NPDC001728]|uniref:hypothetical protein n=1 Tax=Streptomyces sp. NPDC001728 TaxID=3154396 RepID=UPI003330DD19